MYKMVKKSGSRGGYRSFTVERVGKHGSCKKEMHKLKEKEVDLLTNAPSWCRKKSIFRILQNKKSQRNLHIISYNERNH